MLKQKVNDNPWNAYCVDCLRNQATHFELNFGVFICMPCANVLFTFFKPGKIYLKEIYTEQWDPMQLRILNHASNQDFFMLCRGYMVDNQTSKVKYTSKIAKWHKKKLQHLARGMPFTEKQPENANRNHHKMGKDADNFGAKMNKFFNELFD